VLNDLAISDANEIHDADDDGAAGRGMSKKSPRRVTWKFLRMATR
jgi:hypothetical protein